MFKGFFVALVTPFKEDGSVDLSSLARLIEWHLQEGTEGFVLCGTTGEGITLSDDEHQQILTLVLKVVAKRIPVVMGTGASSTKVAFDRTLKAKNAGADGCLVIVPYYNKPTEEGCLRHFQEVNKVGLPTIIYHHPGRTGVKLSVNCLKDLSKLSSIVAIKDSSGDLPFIENLIQNASVPVLAGDDIITYPILQKGALGAISVIGNIIPKEWKKLVRASLERNPGEALLLHKKFQKLNEALMLETNPQGIKYAMNLLGKSSSALRLPLVEPSNKTKQVIFDALKTLEYL